MTIALEYLKSQNVPDESVQKKLKVLQENPAGSHKFRWLVFRLED